VSQTTFNIDVLLDNRPVSIHNAPLFPTQPAEVTAQSQLCQLQFTLLPLVNSRCIFNGVSWKSDRGCRTLSNTFTLNISRRPGKKKPPPEVYDVGCFPIPSAQPPALPQTLTVVPVLPPSNLTTLSVLNPIPHGLQSVTNHCQRRGYKPTARKAVAFNSGPKRRLLGFVTHVFSTANGQTYVRPSTSADLFLSSHAEHVCR